MSKLNLKIKQKKSSTPYNNRRKNLLIVFLCAALLISSSLAFTLNRTSFFASATPNVVEVNNEIDLREAVKNAESGISTVIAFSADIQLTGNSTTDAPLTIPADKDITLTSVDKNVFWKLLSVDTFNTIIVDGKLTLENISVTHTEGHTGRGITVNSKGTLIVSNGKIFGNTVTDEGAGIYNSGTVTLSDNTIITNNTATNIGNRGGGIYTNAFYENKKSSIINATITNNSAGKSRGGYCYVR